jgi:hypothetical protein
MYFRVNDLVVPHKDKQEFLSPEDARFFGFRLIPLLPWGYKISSFFDQESIP